MFMLTKVFKKKKLQGCHICLERMYESLAQLIIQIEIF